MKCRQRGFTLIELMVVLGIILLLISILLPIFHTVSAQTARLRCMNNMKSLLGASMLYAADNDNVMPFANWLSMETPGRRGWLYTAPPTNNPTQVSTGVLWPYLSGRRSQYDPNIAKFYRCPLDEGPYVGVTNWLTSYLCNGATVAWGGRSPYPLGKMRGDGIWYWEAGPADGWNDGSSFGNQAESTRHQTGACVGAFNGSVYWWTSSEFTAEQALSPSRLWCNPDTANGH